MYKCFFFYFVHRLYFNKITTFRNWIVSCFQVEEKGQEP
jgi:hypothetical protein